MRMFMDKYLRDKVSIDKEVGRVVEGDRGGQGRRLRVEGSDRRMW
jgi:hypothetical protein